MDEKRVLITGGLGQVGSYLCDALSGMECKVRVVDNFSSCLSYRNPSVEVVRGDIRDREAVRQLVRDANVVIHCAAQIYVTKSVEDPAFDADNNVMGTLSLLDAARDADVERFVYFSSAAVYGDPVHLPVDEDHPQNPMSPYGVSKLSGEKYALAFHRAYGIPSTAIRPFNIYSPRQDPSNPYSGVISKFIDRVAGGQRPIIFGDGSATRDFVSVHDVVDMVTLMIKKDVAVGKVFNCGTGTARTIDSLAHMVASFYGRRDLTPEHQPARAGDILHSYADISRARNILGFRPQVILEDGIKEIVESKMAAGDTDNRTGADRT
ncbi:MAG: UDP-galactose-4-epimerase [Methanocella sp. PtaU1.Bin125]|nr:MAG: UDP-galactose-4-epimerase [Methanocella sp. PtaU1.Bin125]